MVSLLNELSQVWTVVPVVMEPQGHQKCVWRGNLASLWYRLPHPVNCAAWQTVPRLHCLKAASQSFPRLTSPYSEILLRCRFWVSRSGGVGWAPRWHCRRCWSSRLPARSNHPGIISEILVHRPMALGTLVKRCPRGLHSYPYRVGLI